MPILIETNDGEQKDITEQFNQLSIELADFGQAHMTEGYDNIAILLAMLRLGIIGLYTITDEDHVRREVEEAMESGAEAKDSFADFAAMMSYSEEKPN